ncbi:MAG TPA: hypothetical protein VFL93_12420 [Longimicrobiaceae bacterium]|jgi:hypothetical protein|nr:hypothetical protein [Longimicrobiaceae bacterium]
MLYYWLLFFFVVFGSKVILAVVTIYLLLPNDRRCSQCDEETLLIGGKGMSRMRERLFLGRVQWRWCPHCGWEGMTRRIPESPPARGASIDTTTPTRR